MKAELENYIKGAFKKMKRKGKQGDGSLFDNTLLVL